MGAIRTIRARARQARVTTPTLPHWPPYGRRVIPEPCLPDAGRLQRANRLAWTLLTRETAAARAEREDAARRRVLRIGLVHEREAEDGADRGPSGPAAAARGATVETVEADVEKEDGTREFQRASVARVRDGVMDHYVRAGILTGRRLDAMTMLADLYTAARITPGTGRAWGVRAHGQMTDAQARAWSDWTRACDHVERRSRETVEDVARGRFPCRLNAASELRDGAWDLAQFWQLPPDKRG